MSDQASSSIPNQTSQQVLDDLLNQLQAIAHQCEVLRRTNVAFGRHLQEVREAKNVSIAHVASECLVSVDVVETWERGHVPSRTDIVRIAEALAVPMTDLAERAGY